jgi:hypothetical protein
MAAQLRKPSGWFGTLVMGRMLNRMNIAIVNSTLARLNLKPQHNVLEIGFGGYSFVSFPSSTVFQVAPSADISNLKL